MYFRKKVDSIGFNDTRFNDDSDEGENALDVINKANDGLGNRDENVYMNYSLLGSHKSGTPTRDDSESGESNCSK